MGNALLELIASGDKYVSLKRDIYRGLLCLNSFPLGNALLEQIASGDTYVLLKRDIQVIVFCVLGQNDAESSCELVRHFSC